MKQDIAQAVVRAVQALYGGRTGQESLDAQLEYADAGFGDFSTNIAFRLAKLLSKPPQEVAGELAERIEHPAIAAVRPAGAGYINIELTAASWLKELDLIQQDYGRSGIGKGQQVQVEFISANPTGPLTLGNARGGFLGDVLARVLERAGYDVTREYYFNDAGTQIKKLVESVRAAGGAADVEEPQYQGQYVQELADQFRDKLNDEGELARLLTQEIFKKYLKPSIGRMNIEFDVWFNERDLVESGQTEMAINRLREKELVYEQDGAVWLASTKLGDERDRVLVKSSGDYTYLTNDIPYHLDIFESRRFDLAIKVLGADHAAQTPSVKAAIAALVPDARLDFLVYQFVRLMKGGQEVRMSKRTGTYVTTDELINEVGADVARFFFLMRSADSHMDFDLDLAKEQSQKNPLWYLMYSYVRARSIMEQAAAKGRGAGTGMSDISSQEKELIRQMSRLPGLIEQSAGDYQIHRLSFYGLELAKLFHDWYESDRFIELPVEKAQEKLYLVQRYIWFMESYFGLLGLTPLEKM